MVEFIRQMVYNTMLRETVQEERQPDIRPKERPRANGRVYPHEHQKQ